MIAVPLTGQERMQFYHGTRADLSLGELIRPVRPADGDDRDEPGAWVYLTPDLDAAIWEAEVNPGDGMGRVYVVEALGEVEDVAAGNSPGHPWMSWRSSAPLRVVSEVKEWTYYHGTKVALEVGDLITPGYQSNYGQRKDATFVYFAGTLDAAIWGAELAVGEGGGRIYTVEPTGAVENDPNLTNARFRGNPTKSLRSRAPLRVTGEIVAWKGHPPEVLEAMKGCASLSVAVSSLSMAERGPRNSGPVISAKETTSCVQPEHVAAMGTRLTAGVQWMRSLADFRLSSGCGVVAPHH